MIKRFLSFVALSVTLISPVFADEFVPLQYYEEEPVHYIPQTRMVIPNGVMSIDKNFEIGKLYDNNNKKNDKKTNAKVDWNSKKEENKDIDWCGIRNDLVRDNTHSLEEVINNHHFSDTFKSGALEDILWEMRIGNTSHAFEIFDENFHYCASLLSDEPYNNEYYAGPGGRRGRNSMEDLENAARTDRKSRELLDEIGSFKDETAKKTGKNLAKKFNPADSKIKDPKWWKNNGYDPHKYKPEILKRNGLGGKPMSHYDMYLHKSGEILLRRKGTSNFIRTGDYIK